MKHRGLFATLLLLAICALVTFAAQRPSQSDPAFNRLVDEYFDDYFHYNPSEASADGFHQYDSQLADYSRAEREREIASLKIFEKKFAALPVPALPLEAADLQILRNHIQARLLSVEQIRFWETDPYIYSSGVGTGVFVLMSRNYAPPEERLKSVITRERQMPAVFEAARHNLKNPPRIYTEVALEQLPDTIGFFQKDVPAAFAEVHNPDLLKQFKSSNDGVIASLEKYENFLREDLLPVSKGDFRLGAENYRKKLLYEEMVDIPLDRLIEIGTQDLHRNQRRFTETAARIDPHHTPAQILEKLEKEHPAPDKLLSAFQHTLTDLRSFIEQHHIITVPSQELPIVRETPSFERAGTEAAMETPGAYENKSKEAFFEVTLPEPGWSTEKTEQYMSAYATGTIISTAIHEVYPGHYEQFLWLQQSPSKTRKLIYSTSSDEGWAHYCEQMMLDEGYGRSPKVSGGLDIPFLKLRLGQLQDALLRDARFVVGIEMHTGKMTYEQAIDFFMKEAYQSKAVAEIEAKRGTSDPTYLVYTLGKLEIMKLRDDYAKMKGDKFDLQQFHDELMRQGDVPLKVSRKAMLGNDSPVL
jgi:uncharacterized protein (DUF885 family)